MKLFGITGGIGMGKSTAGLLLRDLGIPVVDTDALARQVVEPGQPAWREIAASFGREVLNEDGTLCRPKLAARVFKNEADRKKLEGITHPHIRSLWREQAERWRAEGQTRAVVIIPLLFEVGYQNEFAAIVCVACGVATQLARLRARGWNPEEIERRQQAQWPVERKMELAHAVIWTEGNLETHVEQWRRVLNHYQVHP